MEVEHTNHSQVYHIKTMEAHDMHTSITPFFFLFMFMRPTYYSRKNAIAARDSNATVTDLVRQVAAKACKAVILE
jgi:hypothetical protein